MITAIFPSRIRFPLVVDEKWQAAIRASLPELPEARRQRMLKEYGISAGDAHTLTLTRALADQFEAAARTAKNPKRVANLVQSELLGRLKAQGLELEQSPISMAGVTASADLVESGAISGKMLKDLYDLCFARGHDFPAVYEAEGRPQQSRDTSTLERLADQLIAANPKQVEQYRAGKKTMIRILRRPGNEGLEGSSQSRVGERSLTQETGRVSGKVVVHVRTEQVRIGASL